MTDVALRAATAAVRAWTTLYTSGLPIEQRDARREEIDSDLWESVNDPASDRRSLALQIAARLIAGIPDDLGWRSEHRPRGGAAMARRADRGGCRDFCVVAGGRADDVGKAAGLAGVAALVAARGEADRRAAAAPSTAAAVSSGGVPPAPRCVYQVGVRHGQTVSDPPERRMRWRRASEQESA